MKLKEKIGILGIGNMGSAILDGILTKGVASSDRIYVYDKLEDKAKSFSQTRKTQLSSSAKECVASSDIILLAVKPQDLASVGSEMKAVLKNSQIIISILAGTPLAKIQKEMVSSAKLVRAMPNLGAIVGEAVTALYSEDSKSLSLADAIFQGCGKTIHLEEKYFDVVTAISGSGPAYFFYLMELLIQAACKQGISEEAAKTLAVQTALGAGLVAQKELASPEELKKRVTSKGGTTEAALKALDQKNFSGLILEAVEAATQRGKELSQS